MSKEDDKPAVRIDLVPKDPEMQDVLDVVAKVEGRRILKVTTSYADDGARCEDINFLLDDGRELRIHSTSLCWFEDKGLMRILPGKTGSPDENQATLDAVPPSGLVAFLDRLDSNGLEEWKEIVGKKDWPEVLKAIKKSMTEG